nr:PDZ domain-containing protein [Aporhodopirellula aestuarii]
MLAVSLFVLLNVGQADDGLPDVPVDGPPANVGAEMPELQMAPFVEAEDQGRGFVEPKGPHRGPIVYGGWYLGVYGHYTETGHLLTQVFAHTAASRAGLEPGDRIVSVNGQQVGNVLGRQYPIDVLLQRHASPGGHVRLLVQDRRTMQLVNLDVRLTRGQVHF